MFGINTTQHSCDTSCAIQNVTHLSVLCILSECEPCNICTNETKNRNTIIILR